MASEQSPKSPWTIQKGCCACGVCKNLTPHAIFPEWGGTSFECMVCRNRVKYGQFVVCSICGTAVESFGIVQPQDKKARIVLCDDNGEAIEEQWPIIYWEPSPIEHLCAPPLQISDESHLPPA